MKKSTVLKRPLLMALLALFAILSASAVLFCLGDTDAYLLQSVTATLTDSSVVAEWPAALSAEADDALNWRDWLRRLRATDPEGDERASTFDGLLPWHTLIFEYPWGKAHIEVRHAKSDFAYWIREGQATYRIPEGVLWFNQYLVDARLAPLYANAAPTTLELRHQGPRGILSEQLQPMASQWFYYDARRLSQPYHTQLMMRQTSASSESLMLQSREAGEPSVNLLEADALQILGLDSESNVLIEAFADAKREQFIADVAYERASGHMTPLMRPGTTYYRVTLNKSPETSQIGEGYGQAIYYFEVLLELDPKVTGYWTAQSAGGLFTLVVDNVPKGAVPVLQQKLLPRVKWHELKGNQNRRFVALLPLGYEAKAGDYAYKITLAFAGGEHSRWQHQGLLKVTPRAFSVQRLTVDAAVESSTRSDKAYAEYNKYFVPARDKSASQPLWEGAFIQPIQGRLTTAWGMKRSVNGALTTYRHNGIDLAAPEGTPVAASNSGRVVLAKSLLLTGNTVLIDHGLGLFSAYLHLSDMAVVEGQGIKKGQRVGKVGSTGFSTGPHLHFSLYHHRMSLDPSLMIQWQGAFDK